MPRMVWCGIGADGLAERIYKNRKQAVLAGEPLGGAFLLRADAVTTIRRKIWNRDKHTCTHCGAIVSWFTMEMHEKIWRGRGGDISVDNGTTLCNNCHADDPVAGHGKRKIQWSV
jgi:hypothetical protein